MAQCLEHPFHLAIAPLVERELDPVAAKPARARRRSEAVFQLNTVGEPAHDVVVRLAFDLDLVHLLDAVARVREPVRERAVVGEQQRAGRIGIEAADWNHARLVRHELDDRRSALRIVRGRDDACGLVQQQVRELLLRDLATVDLDAVGRLHEGVELPRLAVDEHAAGFDQVVGLAPRRHSGPCEIRVEAHG